ncbi:MAG: RNA polymerase sigma factor [Planctomycetota bacterium]
MSISPDAVVLERALAGDAAALTALWEAHREWTAAILMAHLPGRVELDDALQEVAVTLVRELPGLRDPQAFRPWLRAIAVNAARSHGRRERRERPDALAAEPCDPASAVGRASLADEVDAVLAMVATLPVDLREPLLLRAVDGLSQREIAVALGLPETTVETRLARARRALRQRMAQQTAPDHGSNRRVQPCR